MLQLPLDIQLDGSARLDNFYIGDNIQLFKRITRLNEQSDDFLFVWGGARVGKSHLAQAVCRQYSENGLTAAYFPLDNPDLKPEVLEGLEFSDIVCLDSLHSVSADPKWQLAIFNLFNNLKNSHSQFVVFCQQSPQNMLLQLADLKSRLNSMEVYRMAALDDEQRLGFLIAQADYKGVDIPIDVAQFILARTSRGVDNLIAMIDLLDTQSLVQQRKVTIPFVKNVLKL